MSEDRFADLEQAYKDYTVYDQHYEKVGRIDDLFVDENDELEYIGVKTGGFLGRKSTLIPVEIVRVNDVRRLVEVAADEETIKKAPTFDSDNDITPEYEEHVYAHFRVPRSSPELQRTPYGGYYASGPAHAAGTSYGSSSYEGERSRGSVDTEYGERTEHAERDPLERPPEGAPSGGASSGGADLDVPLDEPDRQPPEYHPPREETAPREDLTGAGTTTGPSGGAGSTRGSDVEVQGDNNVRVYKRTRR